jgi:uncharacterized protein YceK
MSTIAHVGIHKPFPAEGVYPGVRIATMAIQDNEDPFTLFYCVDLPPTAVLDTLLVPVDLMRSKDHYQNQETLRRANEEARRNVEKKQ